MCHLVHFRQLFGTRPCPGKCRLYCNSSISSDRCHVLKQSQEPMPDSSSPARGEALRLPPQSSSLSMAMRCFGASLAAGLSACVHQPRQLLLLRPAKQLGHVPGKAQKHNQRTESNNDRIRALFASICFSLSLKVSQASCCSF